MAVNYLFILGDPANRLVCTRYGKGQVNQLDVGTNYYFSRKTITKKKCKLQQQAKTKHVSTQKEQVCYCIGLFRSPHQVGLPYLFLIFRIFKVSLCTLFVRYTINYQNLVCTTSYVYLPMYKIRSPFSLWKFTFLASNLVN